MFKFVFVVRCSWSIVDGIKAPPYALSMEQYNMLVCFAEAVVPPLGSMAPGAKEIGTANYVDSKLLTMGKDQLNLVVATLSSIDQYARKTYGNDFCSIGLKDRADVIRRFLVEKEFFKATFFLRALVLEGFYTDYRDPWYKGKTVWEAVGFGGKRVSDVQKDWSFLKVYQEFGGLQKND
jgi:hypothetical protein